MKHELIKQIEKLDKEFEVHFNKYVADTESKASTYKTLLESNRKAADEIRLYQD
jgi:adenine C2-methylase RlmN of 23S rRNA A2503 and tRNA A37